MKASRLGCAALLAAFVAGCGGSSSPDPTPGTPPSNLRYSSNPATYQAGAAIAANTPSSSGGAVDTYSVAPALPPGLSLNTSTGVIGGTPTAPTATAIYTVTATNSWGSTTALLTITVSAAGSPPSNLTYSANPIVYPVGVAIAANIPTSSGGDVASYSVSPALPPGLSLNTSTGVIGGTPTAVTPVANYTVTATNAWGSTAAVLTITVSSAATGNHPASVRVVSGNSQVGPVGAELPVALVVQVLDAGGAPVAGQAVNFRVVSGGGTTVRRSRHDERQRNCPGTMDIGCDAGPAEPRSTCGGQHDGSHRFRHVLGNRRSWTPGRRNGRLGCRAERTCRQPVAKPDNRSGRRLLRERRSGGAGPVRGHDGRRGNGSGLPGNRLEWSRFHVMDDGANRWSADLGSSGFRAVTRRRLGDGPESGILACRKP